MATAKMTLLEIVQDVLNDMDSDEVNSISDTVEATQIANICRSVYYYDCRSSRAYGVDDSLRSV
jgi:hypothetical protein